MTHIKYVVMNAGVGYNDEIYLVGEGDSKVYKQSFDSKKEAQEFIEQKAKEMFGEVWTFKTLGSQPAFHIGEFSYERDEPAFEWLDKVHPELKDSYWPEVGYNEIIEWCEKHNESFLPYIPNGIFGIYEVEV